MNKLRELPWVTNYFKYRPLINTFVCYLLVTGFVPSSFVFAKQMTQHQLSIIVYTYTRCHMSDHCKL